MSPQLGQCYLFLKGEEGLHVLGCCQISFIQSQRQRLLILLLFGPLDVAYQLITIYIAYLTWSITFHFNDGESLDRQSLHFLTSKSQYVCEYLWSEV